VAAHADAASGQDLHEPETHLPGLRPTPVLDQPRLVLSLLALVVILAVIPPVRTAPNQTALTRISAQLDLARPNWTVENRRLAVISYFS
jgi:hypothetical protein